MGAPAAADVVREYLSCLGRGDARFEELLADDVVWWVPPGSEAGGTYRGKAEVLQLITGGSSKYAADEPLKMTIEHVVAEDDWACVQMILDARTARGQPYRNYFHLAFQVRDGQIVLAKEYLDTQHANDTFAEQ